jgi:hypothetical protein
MFLPQLQKEIRSKALNAINLLVKDTIIQFIRKFTNPNKSWEILKEKYKFKGRSYLLMLKKHDHEER